MRISRLKTYKLPPVDLFLVSKQIPSIEYSHLLEKPYWYSLDGKLHYFKQRNDHRFFVEIFNSIFFKSIQIDSADYAPAIVNDKQGLLTANFQTNQNLEYQDIDALLRSSYYMSKGYGKYSLKNVLHYFKYELEQKNYENIKNLLIQLYVADYFTHQLDRNPKNLITERDTSSGYTTLSKIFDSEKGLGINNSGYFNGETPEIWIPSMPYEDNLENGLYDGIDSHMLSLYMDFPEETLKYISITLSGDTDKVIDSFKVNSNPIKLKQPTIDYLKRFFDNKAKQLVKIQTL